MSRRKVFILLCFVLSIRHVWWHVSRNISVFFYRVSSSQLQIGPRNIKTFGDNRRNDKVKRWPPNSLSLRPSAPFSVTLKARGWPMRREYCQHWPMRGRVLRVCRSLRSCGCLWRTGWRSGTPSTTHGSTITRRQVITWSHDSGYLSVDKNRQLLYTLWLYSCLKRFYEHWRMENSLRWG